MALYPPVSKVYWVHGLNIILQEKESKLPMNFAEGAKMNAFATKASENKYGRGR